MCWDSEHPGQLVVGKILSMWSAEDVKIEVRAGRYEGVRKGCGDCLLLLVRRPDQSYPDRAIIEKKALPAVLQAAEEMNGYLDSWPVSDGSFRDA